MTFLGQCTTVIREVDKLECDHSVGDGDGNLTGQVIVARAGIAQGLVAWAGESRSRSWRLPLIIETTGDGHDTFQHAGDTAIPGEARR